MIYEIINPSDPYTLEASDYGVAAAVAVLLGEGWYALNPLESEPAELAKRVPILALGDFKKWWSENVGVEFKDFLIERRAEIAACLDSVVIGSVAERSIYFAKIAEAGSEDERERLRYGWHDARRSSLNDIARRAWALAEAFRKAAEKAGEKPTS